MFYSFLLLQEVDGTLPCHIRYSFIFKKRLSIYFVGYTRKRKIYYNISFCRYCVLTFSLKVPPDRGLPTSRRSENRKRCRGLALSGNWRGDMAHGASTKNILLHIPLLLLLLSPMLRSPRDFFRNDFVFCKKIVMLNIHVEFNNSMIK